jgi:two-component system response regulator
VVLVDDEHNDLFLLADRLRRANVPNPLITFGKATDAIGFLNSAFINGGKPSGQPPCLVITDIRMPVLDGFQLTGWIRAHRELAHVPVVVLSGIHDPRELGRALKLGASACFPKFPRAETLAAIVNRATRPSTT